MTRAVRTALIVVSTGLALVSAGCRNSRPPGIAAEPGDCYVELSELVAEKEGSELRLRVHYRFPYGFPDQNAWFMCSFEVNGGGGGIITIRRQGRELDDEGDIVGTTNSSFNRQRSGTFAAQMRQSKTKTGQYHDVSAKLLVEF